MDTASAAALPGAGIARKATERAQLGQIVARCRAAQLAAEEGQLRAKALLEASAELVRHGQMLRARSQALQASIARIEAVRQSDSLLLSTGLRRGSAG